MLEKLSAIVSEAAKQSKIEQADPAVFNDPLAMRADWFPKSPGGSNFKTHKLRQVHGQRLEYRASLGMWILAISFVGLGSASMAAGAMHLAGGGAISSGQTVAPLLFGIMFAGAGFFIHRTTLAPIVFDIGLGFYWRGRTRPDRVGDPSQLKNCAPIPRIYALQIIPERVTKSSKGKTNSYISYEINLILDDASRLNVIDHSNIDSIRSDAQEIAAMIGKPMWDATRLGG